MRQISSKQRTLVALIAAALSVSAGSAAFAQGKSHGKDKQAEADAAAQQSEQAKAKGGRDKGGGKPEAAQQDARAQEQAARNAQQAARSNEQSQRNAQHAERNAQQSQRNMQHAQRNTQDAAQSREQANRSRQDAVRHADNAQRQQAQAASVDQLHRDIALRQANKRASQDAKHASKRLDQSQQRQLITRQQAQVIQYRQTLDAQRTSSQRIAAALAQQNRIQQSQYVQQYNDRLWQQQQQYRASSFDYNNDPYFYSAPIYSYNVMGQNYQTNQYGANLLRQAINNGYSEGLRAGRADEMDNWSRPDYRNSYAYQQPYYGYNGYYLDSNQYAYYFRQGFQRGYEDGYYGRSRYRSSSNGTAILTSLIGSILNLRSY